MILRKKTIGIVLITLPFVLLVTVIAGYAMSSFVISQITTEGTSVSTIGSMMNIFLGGLGVLSILGFFISIPLGIYFLSRKELNWIAGFKNNPKYQGLSDQEIELVTKWSWGAFFCPIVWALGNKLWLWFLGSFVPIWNVYVWLKLAIDGRQMVWERSKGTVVQFQKRQMIIAWVILGVLLVSLVAGITDAMQKNQRSTTTQVSLVKQEDVIEQVPAVEQAAVESSTVTEIIADVKTTIDEMKEVEDDREKYCVGNRDEDGDGLLNDFEQLYYGTDSTLVDTDGDGFSDYDELKNGYNPIDGTTIVDSDGDGLANGWEENFYMTDESKVDSDADGMNDREEVLAGTNPDGAGSMDDLIKKITQIFNYAKRQC